MQNKYKIIALFGESGAGKDTIQKELTTLFPNMCHSIISCTTRPKRDYEIDGVNYHFLSLEKMQELINNNEMIETSLFNNWYYGTGTISLNMNKINVGVFNLEGLKSLSNRYDIEFIPVYIYADGKTRLLRNLNREQNPNCFEICRRYLADQKDFEYALTGLPFITIENNDNANIASELITCEALMEKIREWAKELNLF